MMNLFNNSISNYFIIIFCFYLFIEFCYFILLNDRYLYYITFIIKGLTSKFATNIIVLSFNQCFYQKGENVEMNEQNEGFCYLVIDF